MSRAFARHYRPPARMAGALRSLPSQVVLVSGALVLGGAAQAQAPAEFYRGKTLSLIVSSSAGGDYDMRARLVAKHMTRHAPGAPKIIVQNMPGGGGLRAASWLSNVAPQDATALAALQQQIPLTQLFRKTGVDFDMANFHIIGNTSASPIVIMAWTGAGVKTFADLFERELVVGGTGGGSASVQLPLMLNAVLGTKFKVVPGYPGGSEIYLAMERGEISGRVTQSWSGWKSQKADWLAERKITPLAQGGRKRHPELADTPLLTDFARNADDRKLIELMLSSDEVARPILTAQGAPADRVAALRKAFMATMADAEFREEARKLSLDVDAMSGEEAQVIVADMMSAPAAVVERARAYAGSGE